MALKKLSRADRVQIWRDRHSLLETTVPASILADPNGNDDDTNNYCYWSDNRVENIGAPQRPRK